MLNDKAQVMMLLKEAAAYDRLALALDVVTDHTRAGVPDWWRIRAALDAMLVDVRHPPSAGTDRSGMTGRSLGG